MVEEEVAGAASVCKVSLVRVPTVLMVVKVPIPEMLAE